MIRPSLIVAGFLMVQINPDLVLGDQPKLRLVNVVFRHGDRTPDTKETYPNDPYINNTYDPLGRGQLTSEGEQREYQLGKMLKSRYNKFLSPVYDPAVVVASSTDYNRTRMSLRLVLSGLFLREPFQEWDTQIRTDAVLYSKICPQFKAEYLRVKDTPEVQKKIAAESDLMTSLSEYTGLTINDTYQLYRLYQTFDAQRSVNLALPEWVDQFYQNGQLPDAAILEYQISSYNKNLKRIFGGTLLREISDNAVSYVNGRLDKGRKLYLYSGHEMNIAGLQSTLGTYEPHVPAYSSAVIIELWQMGNKYFTKVLSYLGIPAKVVTKKVPGCSELCPIEKFLKLLEPVIATDYDLLCL